MSAELVQSSSEGSVNTPGTTTPGWSGRWVANRLGVSLGTTYSAFGTNLTALVGLAVRRNPRRAHLLVSTVLGKHVPTDPRLVYGSGALLGLLAADALRGAKPHSRLDRSVRLGEKLRGALAGDSAAAKALLTDLASVDASTTVAPSGTVVLGFAETATALGHAVADVLSAPYLHSTRRRVPGVMAVGTFEEVHSHATSHLLLPDDPRFFTGGEPLVLVDDELSTGRTALNTILALHAVAPRARYLIAALVDLRSQEEQKRMATVAADLGADIEVVALAAGTIELPSDVLAVGQSLVAAREIADGINRDAADCEAATKVAAISPGQRPGAMTWPKGLREGARHGFCPADRHILVSAMASTGSDLAGRIAGGEVLVLGHEEFMYAPLCLALALADHVSPGVRVRFSTTTRSPILAVDEPGYAVRTKLTFPAHDDPTDGPGERFAYNVAAGIDPSRRFSDIVLVIDAPADTPALRHPAGLLSVLSDACDRVHLVVVPALLPTSLERPVGAHQ